MGTRQSRSGRGQQGTQGTRNPSERIDRRPEQDRDLQRNKQSDRGQHQQQSDRSAEQQSASGSRPQQQGGAASQQRTSATSNRQDEHAERQQSAQGASGKQADRQQSGQNVYGEGNYAASRQYDKDVKDFAESGRAEPAARAAAPKSDDEARDMEAAEQEGKRHSKGEDPALTRGPSGQPRESPSKPRPGHEEE